MVAVINEKDTVKALKKEKDPYAVEVGIRLREARIAAGFELNDVAAITGYDRQTINTWENGHAIIPTKKLPELCSIFKCSVDSIVLGQQSTEWESVITLLPNDVRQAVLVFTNNAEVKEIVAEFTWMDSGHITIINQMMPLFAKMSPRQLDAIKSIAMSVNAMSDRSGSAA